MTSARQDYETPIDLFTKIDSVFHFGLDAAATPENTRCEKFLTIDSRYFYMPEFDALSKDTDWTELSDGKPIWLNPPYGSAVLPFFKKVKKEYEKGSTIVCLVAGRFETKWHQVAWNFARYFIFFNKRVKFELHGVSQGTATFPSELIVFSPEKWNLYTLRSIGKLIEQNVVSNKELLTL